MTLRSRSMMRRGAKPSSSKTSNPSDRRAVLDSAMNRGGYERAITITVTGMVHDMGDRAGRDLHRGGSAHGGGAVISRDWRGTVDAVGYRNRDCEYPSGGRTVRAGDTGELHRRAEPQPLRSHG